VLSAGERAIDNPEETFEKIPDAVSFEYLDSIGMTVDVAQRYLDQKRGSEKGEGGEESEEGKGVKGSEESETRS
jgi:hypothetical protein